MGRRPRDEEADRAVIRAAADRLLAGTPLHSQSGKLTASELIVESDLRRDVVYRHTDLIQDFQARAKAQDSTPTAMQELADENQKLKAEAHDLRDELRQERAWNKTMRNDHCGALPRTGTSQSRTPGRLGRLPAAGPALTRAALLTGVWANEPVSPVALLRSFRSGLLGREGARVGAPLHVRLHVRHDAGDAARSP